MNKLLRKIATKVLLMPKVKHEFMKICSFYGAQVPQTQDIDRLAFKFNLQLSHHIVCKEHELKNPEATPIEYPYYLYLNYGIFDALHIHFQNVIHYPPNGYRFETDVQASVTALRSSTMNSAQLAKDISLGKMDLVPPSYRPFYDAFFSGCKEAGVHRADVVRFLSTHALIESFAVPQSANHLLLPAYSFFVGPQSWSIMFESLLSLYRPLPHGSEHSAYYFDYKNNPYTRILGVLFGLDNCVAIITHMKSTNKMLSEIFNFSNISKKIRYVPIGYPIPPVQKEQHDYTTIKLLFINSHGATAPAFIERGGREVLHAFRRLSANVNNLRLTICGGVPWDILTADEKHFLRNSSHVSLKESYISNQEMLSLLQQTDVFLIPSVSSFHSISLVQALAHGIPVIATDAWGFDEFIDDGFTGFLLHSHQVKHSYVDVDEKGIYKIDNPRPYRVDDVLVDAIVEKMLLFVHNVDLLKEMSARARSEALRRFSLDRRNGMLKEIFDQVCSRDDL